VVLGDAPAVERVEITARLDDTVEGWRPLPEAVGGDRNWDYRYTWVRDASLTMEALWVAACPDEAIKFFAFLADAGQLQDGADLQIMFGSVASGICPSGNCRTCRLAGSPPVRVGNGLWCLDPGSRGTRAHRKQFSAAQPRWESESQRRG
jgi:hypothetical protein